MHHSLLHNLLKETLKMVALESQELEFFFTLFLIYFGSFTNTLLYRFDAPFKLENPVLLADTLILFVFNDFLEVSLTMLSLLLLAHSKRHRALIKSLIGLSCHLDIISNAKQEESTLRLIKRDLPDELIKAFTEEFFTHRADSSGTSLPLIQLLIEHFSKTSNADTGCDVMAYSLHKVLALFNPLTRWQHQIKDLVRAHVSLFDRRQSLLSGCYSYLNSLAISLGDSTYIQSYVHHCGAYLLPGFQEGSIP